MPQTGRHAPWPLPQNRDDFLWRYMDLAKFVSLIQTKKLFFPRVDALKDDYEGSLAERHYKTTLMTESSRQYRKQWKQKLYVSCWYHSKYRSAAMWAVYGESKASVAIRTTYGRLIAALPEANVFSAPSVGLITYINFAEDAGLDYRNVHGPFFQKDVSLLDKKEFRVMISDGTSPGEAKDEARLPSECTFVGESGLTCGIILENVIDRVFINPAAEAWFSGVVRDLIKDYCPTIILDTASLERQPRF